MSSMPIGALAQTTGFAPSAIRYHEKAGLSPRPAVAVRSAPICRGGRRPTTGDSCRRTGGHSCSEGSRNLIRWWRAPREWECYSNRAFVAVVCILTTASAPSWRRAKRRRPVSLQSPPDNLIHGGANSGPRNLYPINAIGQSTASCGLWPLHPAQRGVITSRVSSFLEINVSGLSE